MKKAHPQVEDGLVFSDPSRIRTCDRQISLPTTAFAATEMISICGLDYLFTVSGAARIVSTEPGNDVSF